MGAWGQQMPLKGTPWAVYIFQPFSSTKPVYFEDENSARIFANGYIEAFRDAGHTVLLINGLVELIVQSKTKED